MAAKNLWNLSMQAFQYNKYYSSYSSNLKKSLNRGGFRGGSRGFSRTSIDSKFHLQEILDNFDKFGILYLP